MIIRRRLTRRFTTVDNCLFDDERLSVEALGVLCYLLGRPNDWQVKISQLADKFRMGRDRTQRVIREIIEAGYAHREQPRDANGKMMAVEYVVTDEPAIPETAPDAADFDEAPQPENTVAANLPQPDLPRPANTVAAYREDSTKTERNKNGPEREARARDIGSGQKSVRHDAGAARAAAADAARADRDFAAWWSMWDGSQDDNLVRSHAAWLRLGEAERRTAVEFTPVALARRKLNRSHYRAFTYLEERKWLDLRGSASSTLSGKEARVPLPPRSQAAFAVFWRRWKNGDAVKVMFSEILQRPYGVLPGQMPSDAEIAALVRIEVARDGRPTAEMSAWGDEMAKAGVRFLPMEVGMPFVWVPSRWPPGYGAASQGDGRGEDDGFAEGIGF